MKNLLFILPAATIALTGCVVYQPSPSAGQYGYTYDYQLPISEGLPAPVYSSIPEPRKTRFYSSTPVVADTAIPAPPTMPPIVSEIPEMTPRPIIQNRTTMIIPQQQQPIVREAAGSQVGAETALQQPAGAASGYPVTTVYSGGFPVVIGATNTNNIPTNGIPTNGIPTNGIPTNGIPTNGVPTNNVPDQFGIPGTNFNEGAGAQPTNNIPNRLEPAPRLPAQPTIPQGSDRPVSSPPPETVVPQSGVPQQQQQQLQQSAPAPAPQQPFAPAAPAPPADAPQQP